VKKPLKKDYRGPKREEEPFKINDQIHASQIRLVGENVENGVVSFKEAMDIAKEQQLDLVLISDKAEPYICRVVDYSKFKYDFKKKQKELKAKTSKTILKEIRFGPNTDDHDFNFKVKHAEKFLAEGSKVKAYVHFAGRTIVYKDRGEQLLNRFIEALANHGKPEAPVKMEGKRMILFLNPAQIKK